MTELTDAAIATRMLQHLTSPGYNGGVNGTCYECPFASAPLDSAGRVASWDEIANDPTEAYFRCSLPGRDNVAVVWGEYAPCTEGEWVAEISRRVAMLVAHSTRQQQALQDADEWFRMADYRVCEHDCNDYDCKAIRAIRAALRVAAENTQEMGR